MPLTYAAGQYAIDGEPVSETELVAFRDQQIDLWAAELGQIATDELGASEPAQAIEFPLGRIERFAARFLARVSEIVTSAYVFAAGGVEAVTEAGWRTVAGMVARQEQFGRGFMEALRSGDLSKAQAVARARQYAGSAVGSFEAGKAALRDFDAPAYPTEDCEGGGNCRCFWSIEEFPGRIEGTWVAVGDRNTCAICRDRARDWAPYVQAR